MKLILASGSPRRKELLGAAGFDFTVRTADVDETLPSGVPAREGVRLLAERKGAAVRDLIGDDTPILSADTLVELDGEKLGKPKDASDAARMLRALSGRAHAVHTGVAVHYKGKTFSDVATTAVFFRPLTEEEIRPYVDVDRVIRVIEIPFDASELVGRYFLVTGTGKYFKNVEYDPEANLGLFRIGKDGKSAELLWGYRDGGRFTSELPAHLMSHAARLAVDPEHRIVLHTHPTSTIAMSLVHPLSERDFTRSLWKMQSESIVVFPEGIALLPWMVCGTDTIGRATADKLKSTRLCVWAAHGIYGTGRTLDEA